MRIQILILGFKGLNLYSLDQSAIVLPNTTYPSDCDLFGRLHFPTRSKKESLITKYYR